MAFLDEILVGVRATIGALDGEDVRRVVAPAHVAGEFGERHDLDRVHAKINKVVEPADRIGQGAHPVGLVGEGADVQFVDDQFVVRRAVGVHLLPVVGRMVVDHAVADRAGHLHGVRVDPGEGVLAVGDLVPVLLPDLGRRHEAVPVAGALVDQLVSRIVPVVELAEDRHLVGVWRPNPERDPVGGGDRTHASDVFLLVQRRSLRVMVYSGRAALTGFSRAGAFPLCPLGHRSCAKTR